MNDKRSFHATEEYFAGYSSEIQYLNHRLMQVIDTLLEGSATPPIIIIQGDHGPGNYFDMVELDDTCLKERYSILNAYYFPEQDYDALYPSISPVNSFRVVLNQYFGADFELLDDRSYFASWMSPYVFRDVTDQISSCNVGSP